MYALPPARSSWPRILLPVLALGSLGLLAGCGHKQVAAAPPPPTVTVTQPVVFPVQSYYAYNGNLDATESVQIVARAKGFLQDIAFAEGDEVKTGDLLFKIDAREYVASVKRAEADRKKAITELKLARLEEDRISKLRATRAVSDQEYEQRVATREMAEAVVMQTDAAVEAGELQLGYTEIRAPIDGQISRTLVTRGNLVGQNQDTPLTSIVKMDPLYVYFDVPEKDLVEYQRNMQKGDQEKLLAGEIPLEIEVATEEGFPHKGKINFRENRVDSGTGTVRIRGEIPNPRVPPANARLLYPGLYARVRVPSGPPLPLPAIPEDALMTGQEGRYVYVLDDKDVVQKRTVKVGAAVYKAPPSKPEDAENPPPLGWTTLAMPDPAAANPAEAANGAEAPKGDAKPNEPPKPVRVPSVVAIESGLRPGDRVIINGLTRARPGAPVTPMVVKLQPPPTENPADAVRPTR